MQSQCYCLKNCSVVVRLFLRAVSISTADRFTQNSGLAYLFGEESVNCGWSHCADSNCAAEFYNEGNWTVNVRWVMNLEEWGSHFSALLCHWRILQYGYHCAAIRLKWKILLSSCIKTGKRNTLHITAHSYTSQNHKSS